MYYLVVVDRYSNWPIVERSSNGADGIISCLRQTFSTFGIPEELSTDGGPEFTATSTKKFLLDWGVHHRISSAYYPHSNCRAELGVKTVKRILMDNTDNSGSLNTNKFQRAILTFRNTPNPVTKISPSQCVFGRPTRDLLPIIPGRYQPHSTWQDTLNQTEVALQHRHMKLQEASPNTLTS